jgi:hypothetical protein
MRAPDRVGKAGPVPVPNRDVGAAFAHPTKIDENNENNEEQQ